MPVIETETIKRRKIVKGSRTFSDGGKMTTTEIFRKAVGIELEDVLSPLELREAAALFTEFADILEKGE